MGKIYHGQSWSSVVVETDDGRSYNLNPRHDLRNHSPDGFAWGYGGSGPAQLSLALLCDLLGDDRRALRIYQDFKFAVVAGWDKDKPWTATEATLLVRLKQVETKTFHERAQHG